jgi:hypothetical protein
MPTPSPPLTHPHTPPPTHTHPPTHTPTPPPTHPPHTTTYKTTHTTTHTTTHATTHGPHRQPHTQTPSCVHPSRAALPTHTHTHDIKYRTRLFYFHKNRRPSKISHTAVEMKGSSASSCAHPSRVALPTYSNTIRTYSITYLRQYLHRAVPTYRNSRPYLQPCLPTTMPTYNTFDLLTTIPVDNNVHLNHSQPTTLHGTPTTAAERGATTLNIITILSTTVPPQYYHNTTDKHATTIQATYYQHITTMISQSYHNITMATATATAAATAAATPAILHRPRPRPRQHTQIRRGDVITTRHGLVPACCISSRQLC